MAFDAEAFLTIDSVQVASIPHSSKSDFCTSSEPWFSVHQDKNILEKTSVRPKLTRQFSRKVRTSFGDSSVCAERDRVVDVYMGIVWGRGERTWG
jgi:hypothetical protein